MTTESDIERIKGSLKPAKCVECFKPLEVGHICDPCQNLISNLTDLEVL